MTHSLSEFTHRSTIEITTEVDSNVLMITDFQLDVKKAAKLLQVLNQPP
ncbi:MAG: hypothetical protein P8K08_24075 [Fuerstiella sp.]|jgi:hypothetical protein|nr:hypothetical protein [Fuerstiella sp.]